MENNLVIRKKIEYLRSLQNEDLLAKYFGLVRYHEWNIDDIELYKNEILRRMENGNN